MKKIIYLSLSIIYLGIGLVGAVLPGLPTTPFLMLSVYFSMNCSSRLTLYIKNLSIYKRHLQIYEERRALRKDTKVKILTIATVMLLVPLFVVDKIWVKVTVILVLLVKYYFFIFKITTEKKDEIYDR